MRFLSRPTLLKAGALACLCLSAPAWAQFAKPEDAVRYRRSAFSVMGTHFGRVAAMAQGKIPFDAKLASDNADVASYVARLPFAGFVPGSDKGDTKADPKIWTEMDKFKDLAGKMQDAMAKLDTAAKSGNLDTIKAAVGETGKTCKACHDSYRKE